MNRKSPFSTTPLSFDAPSPANPREYLHKPYTVRNYVPWSTFLSLTVYRQLCKFSNSFVRKPGTPTHQLSSQKHILTQNGHSRSFKVMYLGIIEEPLRSYIAQYNKCCFRCEGSKDRASEKNENRHFLTPHSHFHSPANPREYPHKTYLARNQDPQATFLSLIVWVYLHANFSGWLRNTCVNATECIVAVQRHFRVNHGR